MNAQNLLDAAKGKRGDLDAMLETMDERELSSAIIELSGQRPTTKRELFAAMAMQGICAHHDTWGETTEGVAVIAVRVADALIAELAKEQP